MNYNSKLCMICFWGRDMTDAFREMGLKRRSENNPNWKGNDVGYTALHAWIKRRFKKSELCNKCRGNIPMDLANISGKYLRDVNDWEWLCRRCHMMSDGRMKNMNKLGDKVCEQTRQKMRDGWKIRMERLAKLKS